MLTPEEIKELRRIEIETARLANEQLVGNYHSVFKGRGLAFDEVRAYQQGDDVRFIDWNVTARSGEPHVKVFREEREMTVMLAVDLSRSQKFGTRKIAKARLTARIAALIAFSAVKNNDRVGLVLFTDEVERIVPPRKGAKHVMRVVAEMMGHAPRHTGTNLSRAFDSVGHLSRRRSAVFVISDFIGSGYEHSLRLAAARHDVVPIIVSDPRESELPDVGMAYVEDLETGAPTLTDTSSARVREAYKRDVAQANAARDSLFKRLGLDTIGVSTDRSYIAPLAEFFRRRARRMRYG